MPESLIINVSRDLGWRRRLASRATTTALWFGFALLWLPVLLKLQEVVQQRLAFEPAAIEVLETVDPLSPWHSLFALLGTCTLLLLWSLLPSRTVGATHTAETPEALARGFDLEPAQVAAAQCARICVVHHDDHGRIVGLEMREGDLEARAGVEPAWKDLQSSA